MIYGSFIDWTTDSTVRETDQLVDWPSNWVYCLETDQLTEWFIAGWLTNYSVADSTVLELTNWLNDLWLVEWLNNWL